MKPALIVELELDQTGRIFLAADSHKDELRLRGWLRRSNAFRHLPTLLERLLDDLDEIDRKAAV